ncbi:hypothetical protein PsYK624_043180 [Phanerochaete sordida]|uniref:Uncharacterized protein n=1 Tax=Phanerochaete sordida TaxID=48140 RepID=A0A9P3G5K0_9APHY|nr:hypothetical protein PsYK624_043180 [Phanerochaete sordida]
MLRPDQSPCLAAGQTLEVRVQLCALQHEPPRNTPGKPTVKILYTPLPSRRGPLPAREFNGHGVASDDVHEVELRCRAGRKATSWAASCARRERAGCMAMPEHAASEDVFGDMHVAADQDPFADPEPSFESPIRARTLPQEGENIDFGKHILSDVQVVTMG